MQSIRAVAERSLFGTEPDPSGIAAKYQLAICRALILQQGKTGCDPFRQRRPQGADWAVRAPYDAPWPEFLDQVAHIGP